MFPKPTAKLDIILILSDNLLTCNFDKILKTEILMTHHKKIGKWLQLGGHSDGEEDLLKVSQREAKEESGINNFIILGKEIFDMDIHEIPSIYIDVF